MVSENFSDHFGDLENFHYAVTRKQALLELDYFIKEILPDFGKTQDMMLENEPFLNHAMLSAYLNAGLLLPLEVCKAAEEEYHAKRASLASVEGFIRQILGWREYIRGIYWLKMPKYADLNTLSAKTPLPDFYWGSETKMHCVAKAVADTQKYAYSHHIQRLMVTGNFALLAGLDVKQVQEWYLSVYIDAHEWVEMPNTLGMALFGDGGIVASKPYAASGKYIYRMSNFCQNCAYCPKQLLEDTACPFNALYWDFLVRHRKIFEKNPRLFYAYNTFDKFEKSKQKAIGEKAKKILTAMRDEKL